MSYDRKLDQICPHRVAGEVLFFDATGTTATPLRPISSTNSVQVKLNGEILVPSAGIYSPASSLGSVVGPFTVRSGVNDRLRFQVNGGPWQTVVAPGGQKLSPEKLAQLLTSASRGIEFYTADQRIGFRTDAHGPQSSVLFDASSTLAWVLGLPAPRMWRGKVLSPGWNLINDPFTLLDRPTKLIVFEEPLRGLGDYIEVSYVTLQQECRRCGGLGVENDWLYGTTGEVVQVTDEALLIQEVQKLFFTVKGSNPFFNWYGTDILESVGQKLSAGGMIQNQIVGSIYQAFGQWQSIKRQQEEKAGQAVSDREFPFRLVGVNLDQSQRDPTVLFITVTIQNRSSEPIQLQRGIKFPQPVDLLGSTQAQGIFRESLSQYTLTG